MHNLDERIMRYLVERNLGIRYRRLFSWTQPLSWTLMKWRYAEVRRCSTLYRNQTTPGREIPECCCQTLQYLPQYDISPMGTIPAAGYYTRQTPFRPTTCHKLRNRTVAATTTVTHFAGITYITIRCVQEDFTLKPLWEANTARRRFDDVTQFVPGTYWNGDPSGLVTNPVFYLKQKTTEYLSIGAVLNVMNSVVEVDNCSAGSGLICGRHFIRQKNTVGTHSRKLECCPVSRWNSAAAVSDRRQQRSW